MKQKEKTAGEPTCLSFSHYKAASLDPMLNSVDTLLRMVPLLVGFSPEAWQVITDVEILKKAGEYRVAKMRLIQLMSPEFQINNKMIGKNILKYAKATDAVAADQHGSRKHHKSINTCLNKKLVFDILRQKKRAGAVAILDASGAYDRISYAIVVLTFISFDIPQKVYKVLFSTLQKAQHHIKAGFGRLEAVHGNEEVPMMGIGQGNGLGPTLWCLISTIIFRMMKKAGHGVSMVSALSLTLVQLVGFAFVDDTDLFCAAQTSYTAAEVLSVDFQAALHRWTGGLIATGGAIAPEKSFCYLIDFLWTGFTWEYRKLEDLPGEFTIQDRTGVTFPLQRYEVSHADKTLGVFIAMDGNKDTEIAYLTKVSATFGQQVRTTKCEKNAAIYALQFSLMKTLE